MFNSLISVQYCYNYLINQIPMGLLLYAHIPTALIALIFGGFLLFNSRKLPNITLFIVCLFFALWCFSAIGSWFAFLGSGMTMFTWSLTYPFSLILFFFSYYFLYTFATKKDLPVWQKVVGIALLLPMIVWTLSGWSLQLFDANTCQALENNLVDNYLYCAEALYLLATIIFTVVQYRKSIEKKDKREVLLAGIGVSIFLGFFLSASLIATILSNYAPLADYAYNFEIYGLFGMPILLIYLGYLIVKYKSFNLKMFGVQALILALVALIGSEFAFISSVTNQILVAITLVFTGAIGILLIRGVKKEIEQREHIEQLAQNLEAANRGQENLIHIMNHQIKGYLGVARNIFAELSEGTDYGAMPEASKPLLASGKERMKEGVEYIQSILKGQSAQTGSLPYDIKPIDLKPLVDNLAREQKDIVERAGLSFESSIADGDYRITGDATMLDEAFKNLITNAIKYNNPKGSITIALSRSGSKILFSVKDAGRGISAEDAPRLFKPGGMGKNSMQYNAEASGFGLAFVKPVVEKHQGRVWFESNSPAPGTTFFIELPAAVS